MKHMLFLLFVFFLFNCTSTGDKPAESITKVFIDTDMGLDDVRAIAVLINSADVEISGITTVKGAASPGPGAKNVLKLIRYFKVPQIPVAKGNQEETDIKRRPEWQKNADNFWGVKVQPAQKLISPFEADEFLYKAIAGSENPVTIICLGPLTNIASLIKKHPVIISKIRQIFIMGGILPDNTLSWNLKYDPEAASVVFNSIDKIVLVDEIISKKFPVDSNLVSNMKKINSLTCKLFHRIHTKKNVSEQISGKELFLWDDLLTAVFLDSTLAEYDQIEKLEIESDSDFKFPSFIKRQTQTIKKVKNIDVDRTNSLILDLWTKY